MSIVATKMQKATNVVPFKRPLVSEIVCADNLEFMRRQASESMHLIVTSPPYNLDKECSCVRMNACTCASSRA